MKVGEEAEEMEGTEEAAHVSVYTQQPGMTADIGEEQPIDLGGGGGAVHYNNHATAHCCLYKYVC